jgi:crotonobetainyl-CoA:carnitine CoA-transferase CaiB-like acyl-CoA transferase
LAQGPLAGVRVVDLTDDSGRFATKLLSEAGASIVRLGSASHGPAMAPGVAGGLLDWWYDGGKLAVGGEPDPLATAEGRDAYRRLAGLADIVIETETPGRLASLGLDHADLVTVNPRLVQLSLTPFGRSGPRAGWATTDLVSSALGGVLSLCGLPDQPVNPWGRQAFNFAGFLASTTALAALRDARRTGQGRLIDMAVFEAVLTTVEQLFFQYWFDDVLPYPKIAPRQGSLHWIRAYKVVPAKQGHILVTPTPNAAGLLTWMVEKQIPEALELVKRPLTELVGALDEVIATMAAFALTEDAGTLFREAQERHIAWGEVQSVAQVAANPQHAYRGFFRRTGTDPAVTIPGPVAVFKRSGAPDAAAPNRAVSVEDLAREWEAAPVPETAADAAPGRPLAGIRVLDLSHVLAGPMCTRVLGDLGADIVKVQTAERSLSVNDPNHPYFYTWNRSKRGVSLNMRHPRAVEVVRRLVEQSDVLIENFSAGVLDRWGLSYEQVRDWNPRIVYVSMSGCGHEGPWSKLVTYAPTIHAIAGLTYLSNPPGRTDLGPGFSLNDHAAGLAAAFSVMAALTEREASGAGQHVDISQTETGSYLIGPSLIDYITNGREAQPVGNRDPFGEIVPNEVYPTADGQWVAISCRNDQEWAALAATSQIEVRAEWATLEGRQRDIDEVDAVIGAWAKGVDAERVQELLQGAGVPAGRIQNAGDLMEDPQLLARELWHTVDHPVFGERPHHRYPALWDGIELGPYRPAPAYVGEHNFEVYGELLGWDEGEVAENMADLFS